MLAALLLAVPAIAHAQDDAGSQLGTAVQDGQDAVNNPSDEGAKEDLGRTFDGTSGPSTVDTTTPSEGSSGLDNAPTYNPDSGSGLDNAPTSGDSGATDSAQ